MNLSDNHRLAERLPGDVHRSERTATVQRKGVQKNMSIRKRFGRAGIAALLVAAGLVGISSNASANPTSSVTTNGVTNACTVAFDFDTPSAANVSIDWDDENLQWPTTAHTLGNFSVEISATGEPGNRVCKMSSSNTAFLNGAATQLLPASALQVTGTANYGISTSISFYLGQTIPLGNPGGGTGDSANQWSGHWTLEIDPINSTPGINQQAPKGTYTSTITVTVSAVAP